MKNFKFLIIKKRAIFAILLCIIAIGAFCGMYFPIKANATPKPVHTIVIDAGHGGRDGGAVGVSTGITESELNLTYAKALEQLCKEFGIKAVLTRNSMDGLYAPDAPNKKKSEMQKREQIINGSGGQLMISIHMNSFPTSSSKGAQVFYAKGSETGFKLAKSVQMSISQSFESARNYVTVGDYYVLNCAAIPAILVECGFLSNPEEEKLLVSKEYCKSFCYSILAGVLSFFEM